METDKTIKKSYYSITPAEVRYCKALGGGDPKHLYGEITALCNQEGYCWASNKYFADLYEVDVRTVRRWIKKLEDNGFINVVVKAKSRKIYLAQKFNFRPEGLEEPVQEQEPQEETKPAKPKKEKYTFTDGDLYLAELLYSKVIYNFPAYENKKIKIDEWADDIRKLREIDEAKPDQIEFMIYWLQGGTLQVQGKPPRKFEPHDFWAKNILSAKKLRKQWFENLVPQLTDKFKKEVKKHVSAKL